MNTKNEHFKALEQVIENLDLETKKIGIFSDLLARVNDTAKDVNALVSRQEGTHNDLIGLVNSTAEPVKVINTLSSTLEKEIDRIYLTQNANFEQQQANQSEQFKELFKTHHDMLEKLCEENTDLQSSNQARLDSLFTMTQDPIEKIKALTKQLEQEITQLQSTQKDFQEQQNAHISEKFESLLNIQHKMATTLRGEVMDIGANNQDACQSMLEKLIASTEAPIAKVQEITCTLGQTLESLHTKQSTFHTQQEIVQKDLLNSALSHQKEANQTLKSIMETISDEIKKIDPQLIIAMGNTYDDIYLRLESIGDKINSFMSAQKEQTNHVLTIDSLFESKIKNIESRFTQLEGRIETLENSLEGIQVDTNNIVKSLNTISSKFDDTNNKTRGHKNSGLMCMKNDEPSINNQNSKHLLYFIGILIILLFFFWPNP